MSDEAALLMGALELQRAHVLGAMDGLSDEQLRRPVLPSGWTCLGLVRHLTLADERYWFRCVIGGESDDYFPKEPQADWLVGPDETRDDVIGAYRAEIERSNQLVRDMSPDDAAAWRDPRWQSWGRDFPDVRTVMLHMIIETATHAGHVDAVRELIDGQQWIRLS